VNWINFFQVMNQCPVLVNAVMKFPVPMKVGETLD
jgi:hypothetical protein